MSSPTLTLHVRDQADRSVRTEMPAERGKEAWIAVYYAVSDIWNAKAPYGISTDAVLEWSTSDGRSGSGRFWELPHQISGF